MTTTSGAAPRQASTRGRPVADGRDDLIPPLSPSRISSASRKTSLSSTSRTSTTGRLHSMAAVSASGRTGRLRNGRLGARFGSACATMQRVRIGPPAPRRRISGRPAPDRATLRINGASGPSTAQIGSASGRATIAPLARLLNLAGLEAAGADVHALRQRRSRAREHAAGSARSGASWPPWSGSGCCPKDGPLPQTEQTLDMAGEL